MPNDKMDKDERRAKILAELKASKQKRIDNPNLHNQLKELDNFLREYGSIEALWKNVEKKKNDTKTQLRKAEKELVDATIALEDVVGKLDEGDKKKSYKELIEGAYGNGNEKHAKKFIEKFPNWSIAIGKMFSESPHFQRIFQASATTRNFKDIHRESNFELKRTGKGKIQGDGILSKIKSGWKSLKTAFSNYIKPDDIGKASKSSLARRIKKFGEEINRPWRMWWDFAAAGDAKLSKDDAKKRFKEKLKTNDPVQVAEFFNHGPSESGGEHEYAIVADKSNDYTQCKGFSYMNMVVEDLDKNLLKDVAAVFDVNTKDIENNIANRDKITASNIFQDKDRKPEDYEKFFSILEIKDYYDNEHNDEIVTKISELLKEIEGEEKLSKLAGTENANIIKFLKSARISYVIKNNKMKEKSEIIANLENIRNILELSSAGAVDDNNLLNEKDSGLGGNTKKIIDEIEDNWDKEIAKKFKDAIDILLKPTEQQLKNIKAISDKAGPLPDVTGTPQQFTTKKQVALAIRVIEDCQALTDESHNEGCTYDPENGRKVFLVDLAVRFGVHGITTGNIQDLCKSKVNLQPPYDNNTGAQLVQRIRNIIGHGLGYGTHNMGVVVPGMKNPNSLPDIKDKDIVEKICKKLKIDEKKKLNDNDEKIVKELEPKDKNEDVINEDVINENVINENDQKGEDKIIVEEKKEPEKEIKEKPKNKYAEMYNKDNLNNAKGLFGNVEKFGKFTKNNNNIKITTADQVSTALNAIKSIGENAGYKDASNSRKTFLGAVAKYLGIDNIGNLQSGVYNGNNKLDGKFDNNPAAEFLMHLRNLIAYGLDYGTGNAMPDIGLFETLSKKIKTQMGSMSNVSDNLEKMIQESNGQVYKNALNVINGFDIRYDNSILASKNFENFKSQIETKCTNNKVYLVLFGELFEKLEIICRAIDNKMVQK